MSNIIIPGELIFFSRWKCRRCGKGIKPNTVQGVAKTTIPLPRSAFTPDVTKEFLNALRVKLVKVHAREGCIASPSDFIIEGGSEEDAKRVGL